MGVLVANMAAVSSILLRNYGKVASGKRLLFSNPCFASLSMRQGLTRANLNEHKICLKSFSSTTKSLQEATCKDGENYAKLWTIERGVAIAMVPLVPAAFIFTSPTMDYLVAFTFTLHAHWGLEAIVIDYLRPKIVGETIARLGVALVYALSAFTLGGLFYFNYTDVGVINAIKMFWKL